MKIELLLHKMLSEYDTPVRYYFKLENEKLLVNNWLNKSIQISYHNVIHCIYCNKKTKSSFFQGFCYPCFISLPQTDSSVINPEFCEAHNGVARDMEWAKKNCLIDHYVYLSLTSGLKVGVTRHTQLPTRWIDQGAKSAIKLAITPYRQLAGLIEVELKQYVNDKTNWRNMLKGINTDSIDLLEEKERLCEYLPHEYQYYICDEDEITNFEYPVLAFPGKVKSINLDKTNTFTGKLKGIKGQYLIFEDGHVFNIRKHGGYKVSIKISD